MKPDGIWYTPVTGIWQTVWLEPVGRTRTSPESAPTPDIDKGEVEFVVDVAGMGGLVSIGDRTDNRQRRSRATGKPGEPIRLKVENPKLWTPDSPHLYEVEVSFASHARDSADSDSVTTYFAMRKISAAKDDKGVMRLMLNNKPLFQIGPLDQGWWPDGLLTPPSDAAMRYDIEVLKKLGFNMLRKHIKVEPAR